MKILIEICLDDLYLLLFDKTVIIDRILLVDFKKKSDKLSVVFDEILTRNNLNVENIKKFYVTQGPGSFMGIRAGLLFVKTITAILDKDIYVGSTFDFLKTDKYKDIYIKAGAKNFYTLINKKIKLVKGNFTATKTDYDFIENNLKKVLSRFKKTTYFKDDTFYMKEPTVG